MKKVLGLAFLSIAAMLCSCGSSSQKSANREANGEKGSSCFDEYSKMHDLGTAIANSYGDFSGLVLDWHFNEETISEAMAVMEEMQAASAAALTFNPTCDKLKKSKVLLDDMAQIAKPKAEEAIKAMNEMRQDDKYYDVLNRVYKELSRDLKIVDFLETINESGANVIK